MIEQKLHLPDFLVADLYKNTLVEIENNITKLPTQFESKNVSAESLEAIKYLGKNGRNVSVVVKEKNAVFVAENDLTFLTNILKACGLNMADIAIVNVEQQKLNFSQLKNELNASKILMFDATAQEIGLPFTVPHFQVQKFDECSILLAPALAAMNLTDPASIELKKKLWTALKKMFDV